ncbi:type I polyketide synthase [Amycolatopsis pigmentata]|uniref:Type I polyketide synthase n=1 Tax=Amycolatopsis pigmentata TaxID=450801 RepID=A0ABW5FZN9_9PSEU
MTFPDGAVAVIAMAGKFPGAPDVERFWANLCDGVESVTVLAGHADPDQPAYLRANGVLADADAFDARYFGMSANQALVVDPQQRLFLECAHEALERAGYGGPDRPVTGVFAGGTHTGYAAAVRAHLDRLPFVDEMQIRHGNSVDFLATRAAYQFGLTGPAMAVQSACSTSLVAVHTAVQSLLAGDCDMALAGGATVHAHPPRTGYTPGGVATPDGHCRPFDAAATGTMGASAVGLVVLRPLADAVAAGDPVHAVILGSAVTNDGRDKVGFTAPGVAGQAEAIRAAQDLAGVGGGDIGYVEAHGTGTPLGDPIEVAALTQVFREHTTRRQFCRIGSVKSNFGHADAASGVVGLIKAILVVEHGLIPPTLNFTTPNPEIDFPSTPFRVNDELSDWAGPRIAAVNSLGIGGTNAHVILGQAPERPEPEPDPRPQLLVVSAATAEAAERAAQRLADHLAAAPGTDLADAARTCQEGRAEHRYRRYAVARTADEAASALRAGRTGSRTDEGTPFRIAYLFPGQGGHYPGMAARLYDTEEVYRRHVDEVVAVAGPGLLDVLRSGPTVERRARLDEIGVAQPAVFAFQYAMAGLLSSWGLRPDAVLGHSLGAYAAACVAGVFSVDDAIRLVLERGRLLREIPTGAMAAVHLAEADLVALLPPGLDIAAVNGPGQCTVAGPVGDIETFAASMAERGTDCRVLRVGVAGHSAAVDPVLDRYTATVAATTLKEPAVPMVSDATGLWATPSEVCSPGYWAHHMRAPVRFGDALATLFAEPGFVLVDLGPGRTAASLARQHPGARPGQIVVNAAPHAAEAGTEPETALAALGHLWSAGVGVSFGALHNGRRRRTVSLPTYPFERQRYLVPEAPSAPRRNSGSPEDWTGPLDRAPEGADQAESALEPANSVLDDILDAFGRAFGATDITPTDGFFDLGGDSLVALRFATWATRHFGVPVSGADVLRAGTAAELAAVISQRVASEDDNL